LGLALSYGTAALGYSTQGQANGLPLRTGWKPALPKNFFSILPRSQGLSGFPLAKADIVFILKDNPIS
jgi:hypothetical protein